MERINVAGLKLSELALGSGKRGPAENDRTVFAIMDRYIELGGNCFDTARKYADGQSDEALGRWLRSRGLCDQVIIVTKGCFPADSSAMHISRLSPAEIESDLEESLRAIGTDHTDLHLLHRDNPRLPVADIMITLDRLVKAGKARAVGCSNWTIGRIIEANEFAAQNGLTPFSLCQIHFSLAVTTAAQTKDVTHVPMSDVEFGWYVESQFPIMGYGPQGRGYFKRVIAGEPLREGDIRYYDRIPENRRRAARLDWLAKALGRSPVAICVAYTRDNKAKCIPLSGFSSVGQLEESFDALNFHLTPAQIDYLETGRNEQFT
ncbi:MAG: aldo/keto reductase [Clostridia bacterium]|nr:aldo/keto reductase [Clostridia bacterium]